MLFEYRIYFREKRGIIVQQGRKETTQGMHMPLPLDPGGLLAGLEMTRLLSFHATSIDSNRTSCVSELVDANFIYKEKTKNIPFRKAGFRPGS